MNVGTQIAKIRKSRKLSLTELSRISGVQTATICRIENGKMTGTLESHISIAKALGVELVELYKEGAQKEQPIMAGAPEKIAPIAEGKAWQEVLAHHASSNRMLPLLIKIEANGAAPGTSFKPGTERFIYILEGEVEVQLQNQTATLSAGMSLYFNASSAHSLVNKTSKPTKMVSVMTPVDL